MPFFGRLAGYLFNFTLAFIKRAVLWLVNFVVNADYASLFYPTIVRALTLAAEQATFSEMTRHCGHFSRLNSYFVL